MHICLQPFLVFQQHLLYGMNIFNSSSSLLLCSELWICKVPLTVLLILFNGYPFSSMVFLIYDICLFNEVLSLQINFANFDLVFDLMRNGYTDLCELVFDIHILELNLWCNGKYLLDAFSIVNSTFSLILFNFCSVSPRSCELLQMYH